MPHLMSYMTTACVRGRLVMTHICARRRREMCECNAYAAGNTASQLLAVPTCNASANNIAWLIGQQEMRKVEWRKKSTAWMTPGSHPLYSGHSRRSVAVRGEQTEESVCETVLHGTLKRMLCPHCMQRS